MEFDDVLEKLSKWFEIKDDSDRELLRQIILKQQEIIYG